MCGSRGKEGERAERCFLWGSQLQAEERRHCPVRCWITKPHPTCATNTEQPHNCLRLGSCLPQAAIAMKTWQQCSAKQPRSNGLRMLFCGKIPFKHTLGLAWWSGSSETTWAAVGFTAGRWQCPWICCRAVLAPWQQPVLPSQRKMCWMYQLSSFLPFLFLFALASSVFMFRSCQQGGKGQFSSAKGERGDLRSWGWDTLALPLLWPLKISLTVAPLFLLLFPLG